MYQQNDAGNELPQSEGTVVRLTTIRLAIVVAALLVAPFVGEAQRAEKVYRVGYLGGAV
jgi:hypothetical protein